MNFFTIFPRDWLSDTLSLSAEATGALWNLVCAFIAQDGRLRDDDGLLARVTKLSTRRWRTIKETLIEGGFIEIRDGRIYPSKFEDRLEKDGNFARSQRDKAKKKWAKKRSNPVKNEESASAPADATPNPTLKNTPCSPPPARREGGERQDYAFKGTVIRLTRRDLDHWRTIYHAIPDLEAELTSIDDWCARKRAKDPAAIPNWFHQVKGMLNRKHQEFLAGRKANPNSRYWRDIENGVLH